MLEYYILLPCVIASGTIGILVFAQSRRSMHHVLFAALSLIFIVIAIANTLSLAESHNQQFAIQTVMAFTSFGLYVMYLFAISLHQLGRVDLLNLVKGTRLLAIATAAVVAIDYSPFLFSEIIAGSPPKPVPSYGVVVYIVHFLVLSTLSAAYLYRITQSRKVSYRLRQQSHLVLVGLVPIVLLAPLTSFVLPVMLEYTSLVMLSPVYTLFFVLCVGYAVARHGLFDVRIAAVRTLAYVLSLLSMAGVYFGLAYIVSSTLFQGTSTAGVSMSPVNIGLALVLAFIFQPIKQFFDRVTNRIFFRDRYDRDRFISQLGDILTSTTTLRTMLDRAARHIQDSLNAAHTAFIVFREDKPAIIVGSQDKPALKKDDLDSITAYIGGQKQVMVIDDVHEEINSAEERRVRKLLRKHRVALILPLSDQTGYLLLGDQKASGYTKRDIRVLETISNELVIAIQNARSVEEVRLLNATLQQSIDEATSELRRSNEKLRKLDATKDEFVSMASHQLRTPLTSIKGYISMLLEGDAGKISKQQEKLLKEAFSSSERMVRLISDFLNVSRLQTGKFMIDAYPVDLARVIGDEIESIRSMAVSHGQTLSYFGPKTLPDVMIDEDKTRQVVMNFIDNAIYYSPAGSDISVKLKTERGKVVFEVHDHGIGVPKHVQSQLFTKFFRAENARKQRPDGTGVGLYLAKRVIEAQGGEIIFHSRPGMGSVFGFRLPLKK